MKPLLRTAALLVIMAAPIYEARGEAATFAEEAAFLKKHTDILLLSSRDGQGRVAVAPAWQGRVMTSTFGGDSGPSLGWLNRDLISSGKLQPHINVFGGEDRFWVGPEGGQFSVFFRKGVSFELSNWFTPAAIDTLPYQVIDHAPDHVRFVADFALTNYSGTPFQVRVERSVRLLESGAVWQALSVPAPPGLSLVAYESANKLINAGQASWTKETGLLSVWILGQFNISPGTVIVAPIRSGPESELGAPVTSDYFGPIPPDRLAIRRNAVYLRADGNFRSKIGISPRRSRRVLGSYDPANSLLTIVQFSQPEGAADYVNSLWKIQENPYGGDVANSYNDGPPSPGAKPLGPFYELESSSPAAALAPGASLTHLHRTVHLSGSQEALDEVSRHVLGVTLNDIQSAFAR
jgi:hypothetical protein